MHKRTLMAMRGSDWRASVAAWNLRQNPWGALASDLWLLRVLGIHVLLVAVLHLARTWVRALLCAVWVTAGCRSLLLLLLLQARRQYCTARRAIRPIVVVLVIFLLLFFVTALPPLRAISARASTAAVGPTRTLTGRLACHALGLTFLRSLALRKG